MIPANHSVAAYTGSGLVPWLDEVARLRIEVFREWPYLYDGYADAERRYLRTYVDVADALLVICRDDTGVVGASTALPLRAETADITAPFRAAGIDLSRVLYCGESVLDAHHRGQGIGVRFFEERERHARRLAGVDTLAFCAVQRDAADPRRPTSYQPLDAFWRRRGFVPRPDLRTTLSWRELGESAESPKPMMFWLKSLETRA